MSNTFLKDDCFLTTDKFCFAIEFYLDEDHRHGFHASQLIDYTLEPNPDAVEDDGGRASAPPQKLTLAFSTADVVVLGWRLSRLADNLRDNRLAAIGKLPKRYADFDRNKPFVVSIAISPITK